MRRAGDDVPGARLGRDIQPMQLARLLRDDRVSSFLLVAPALTVVGLLFVYPLGFSLVTAFEGEVPGSWTVANFIKAFDFYSNDILFTVVIVGISTVMIGTLAIAIGGYLTLGENPTAVVILKWLYRWPLFIPFVVAGQLMRTFLAKNGLMNNLLVGAGLLEPIQTTSFLDWRGIVITSCGSKRRSSRCWSPAQWPPLTGRPSRRRATWARGVCASCWRSSCRRYGRR